VKSERYGDVAGSFRDLRVYQLARAASAEIFAISKSFPNEERFALTDQIRRSTRATKAMISEAWARRRYKAVFINKLDEALGEANETRSWLDDALDCGYLDAEQFEKMERDWCSIASMLARMIDRASDFCKYASDTDYRAMEESLNNWDETALRELDNLAP
jgi:four helix bundle protein